MGAAAVPEQDDGAAHVKSEVAEKPEHLRTPNVHPWVERQGEGDLAPAGRHDQGANAGHLFMGAGAHGQGRRGSARRPRAPQHRHHQKAGFIEGDQVGAESAQFAQKTTRWSRVSRSGCDFERDVVALALESLDGATAYTFGATVLVVIGPGLPVAGLPGEEVIGGHEDCVGDREADVECSDSGRRAPSGWELPAPRIVAPILTASSGRILSRYRT